jgi:hypothetical protein
MSFDRHTRESGYPRRERTRAHRHAAASRWITSTSEILDRPLSRMMTRECVTHPPPACGDRSRFACHCEPTGRANARPMTGSTKHSMAGHRQIEDGLLRRFTPVRKRLAFVAGNDGGGILIHASAFPRREAPELCKNFPPRNKMRAWGMPGARCTRSLACEMGREHTR